MKEINRIRLRLLHKTLLEEHKDPRACLISNIAEMSPMIMRKYLNGAHLRADIRNTHFHLKSSEHVTQDN